MVNVTPPLLRDLLFKRDGAPVNMWATIRWSAPGAVLNDVGTYAPGTDRKEFSGQLGCHILTPESEDSTWYFTAAVRQGPAGSTPEEGEDALLARIAELRVHAFKEQDDPMLKAQRENMRKHPSAQAIYMLGPAWQMEPA